MTGDELRALIALRIFEYTARWALTIVAGLWLTIVSIEALERRRRLRGAKTGDDRKGLWPTIDIGSPPGDGGAGKASGRDPLPCPFCGHPAAARSEGGYDRVECTNNACEATIEAGDESNLREAIAAWNRRAR